MGRRKPGEDRNKLYIHFGSEHFEPARFQKAQNRAHWFKPLHGLWGSPVDAEFGWQQWCEKNEYEKGCGGYRDIPQKPCFYFRLDNSQIYRIETEEDVMTLPMVDYSDVSLSWDDAADRKLIMRKELLKELYENAPGFIDFEKVATGDVATLTMPYYALDVKIKDVEKLMPFWDCDSVVVLDDHNLVENYDAKFSKQPITLGQVLPVTGQYVEMRDNICVAYLSGSLDGKTYVYSEEPSVERCFKTLLVCLTDGRVVENGGYTFAEAEALRDEIIRVCEEQSKEENNRTAD